MFFDDLISFVKENRFKGRRQSFQLDDEGLEQYIRWAFCGNHLMLVSSEKGISGVAVAYALPKPYNGYIANQLPYDDEIPKEQEQKQELCVMDWCALDTAGRVGLVQRFKTRFPNWANQRKWGIQFDKVSELSNKYINLIHTI